jgi:hypothetical protein
MRKNTLLVGYHCKNKTARHVRARGVTVCIENGLAGTFEFIFSMHTYVSHPKVFRTVL